MSDINVSDNYCVYYNVSLNTITNHSETIIKRRHLDTTVELRIAELTNSIDQNICNYPTDEMVDSFNSELADTLDK